MAVFNWLLPWEFSPSVLMLCAGAALLFGIGCRREAAAGRHVNRWRKLGFGVGLAALYVPLQTHFDYLAQHMFWIHRLQHLLLHHLGPFLIALVAPWTVMAAGLPRTWRRPLHRVWFLAPVRLVYRVLQQPVIAVVLFTGLIWFWLWPSIHFTAMLNATEYQWMNWSMALDGLLFWWLILDPRRREDGAQMGYGARMPVVLIAMLPQIVIGAYLSLHDGIVYDVYAVCGRLWPISPVVDQHIGGLITWIPSSMMSVLAALILMYRWVGEDTRRAARARQNANASAS